MVVFAFFIGETMEHVSLPRAFCWIFTVSEILDAKLINLKPVNELFFHKMQQDWFRIAFMTKAFSMTLNCEVESIFGVLTI